MATIRETTDADRAAVLAVHDKAFGREEIVRLVDELFDDPTGEPRLSLIAEADSAPVGHVFFTAVQIAGAERDVRASILAPLAVVPQAQGQGVGGALVRNGLQRLAAAGTELVFVLGHPTYYPRFGFVPAGEKGLEAPYPIAPKNAGAWMVLPLGEPDPGAMSGKIVCADALDHQEHWVE